MTEIEVKILEIDQALIEQKLISLGATKTFDGVMRAVFFDFEDNSIALKGDLLRLRQEGESAVFAYKKNITQGETKVMEELETVVTDPQNLEAILSYLGIQATRVNEKHRVEYTLGDVHVVFDDYHGHLSAIPVFLEIEAPSEEKLFEMVRLLGYKPEDCNNWNTRDLIVHYGI